MKNLDQALTAIATMRTQLARSTQFRGYGPVTLALTGLLAAVAAVIQTAVLPDPVANVSGYLKIWIPVAVIAVGIVGLEAIERSRRAHLDLAEEMMLQAVEYLLPAFVAGALLTFVLLKSPVPCAWMLPGLWQLVLSLGMFASCRSLPRPMIWVGIWYMASGLVCISLSGGRASLSPWQMGIPFGVGQVLAAILLRYTTTRDEVR
jgi:hypothetical protein